MSFITLRTIRLFEYDLLVQRISETTGGSIMFKRIFAFLALAFALFGTQCWAVTCTPIEEGGLSCTNTFDQNDPTNTYNFSGTGDGILTVQFDTVLTTFTLTVTVNHVIDPLDPKEFPSGTVCVLYQSNGGQCDQYDFTGSAVGPNGVPVKNTDYKGLISITLSYFTSQTIHTPAFGHAPGDNATAVYSEDILTSYSSLPIEDPTMSGKTPGISSVAALDEPFSEADTFCSLSLSVPEEGNSLQEADEIEVALKVGSGTGSSCTGKGIRDKTARFSVWTTDFSGNVVFSKLKVKEEGNKFHWDSKNGVNELDLSTEGLAAGTYTITVTSSKFSPQDISFTVAP
jgi:hypothetical protein